MIAVTPRRLELIKAAETWRHLGFIDNIPIAPAWINRDKTSTVYCPYCGMIHHHGIISGPPETEHRIEHCSHLVKQGKGYFLQAQAGEIPDEVIKAAKSWGAIWKQRSRRTHGLMTADELLQKELDHAKKS
jgi:hypothetical protein